MNKATLAAITRHGESLLKAFPNATEKNPVALCKKLRRIETSLTKPLTDACNGDFKDDENGTKLDAICDKAKARVWKLLGKDFLGDDTVFINRDPRGCALKLDYEWTRQWNNKSRSFNFTPIQTDLGGYGLLAPDFNQS